MNKEIEIPEGYEARIEGNKVIFKPKKVENERIREMMIRYFTEMKEEGRSFSLPYDDCLTYLEKQKEQKSFYDTQEYLKGVARVQDYDELTKFEKVFDRIADTYAHRKNKDGYNEPWYTKERAAEMLYHAKEELGLRLEQNPAEWSEEDERYHRNAVGCIAYGSSTRKWLEELPKRFILKPEQEWSEEDDEILKDIIYSVNGYDATTGIIPQNFAQHEKKINWLKSIHPQPHWKPSEEQMKALEDAFRKDGGNEYRKVINSLYCDLEKLL